MMFQGCQKTFVSLKTCGRLLKLTFTETTGSTLLVIHRSSPDLKGARP